MTSQPFYQNTFILRRPRVAILADIFKIVTMFIKAILQDSKKFKRKRIYVTKTESISVFLDRAKFADFR